MAIGDHGSPWETGCVLERGGINGPAIAEPPSVVVPLVLQEFKDRCLKTCVFEEFKTHGPVGGIESFLQV